MMLFMDIPRFIINIFFNDEIKAKKLNLNIYENIKDDKEDPCNVCLSENLIPKSSQTLPCFSCQYDKLRRIDRKILKFKKDNNIS